MARKKGTPSLSKEKQERLKDLFLQSGVTPYQASQELKISPHTAIDYFNKFAEELTREESHEDWFSREKRVRARALEGYSNNIKKIRSNLDKYDALLDKAFKDEDHPMIDQYERITRNQTAILIDLIDRFDALEMSPPTEILLNKEIEMRIAAKQGIKPNYSEE